MLFEIKGFKNFNELPSKGVVRILHMKPLATDTEVNNCYIFSYICTKTVR